MREIRRYEITCDGYTTEGKKCVRRAVYDVYDHHHAEHEALTDFPYPWKQDHRGWICGRTKGHRGDR